MRPHIHGTQGAARRGLDAHRVRHLRPSQRGLGNVKCAAIDHLTMSKGTAIRDRDCTHIVRVDEIHIVNIPVQNAPVANERIAEVDPLPESHAATEPREERFAKAQGEPADAESKSTAEEPNKGRSINRRAKVRPRAPSPPAADERPASIVEWRKTPRRVVHPGPAPRADIIPVARAVGSPVATHFVFVGIPDVPVLRLFVPRAMIVQVAVSHHVARNVFCGNRIVFFQIAFRGPAIQPVGTRRALNIGFDILRASEFSLLTGVNRVRLAAGGDFALSANDGDARILAALIHINAERARLLHHESQIRRVQFVDIALAQLPHTKINAAFREAHLNDVAIQVQKRKSRHATQMNGSLSRLQLRSRIFVHPQLVADSHRAVLCRTAPVTLSAGLQ